MSYSGLLLMLLVSVLAFSSFSDDLPDEDDAADDLCKLAKDYHSLRNFKHGDEILELHKISKNHIWVGYSGAAFCTMEFAKATRNCEKILVKNGETECILGHSLFKIPPKVVRGTANN